MHRLLDHENTATLVHAFVTSCIDYGNAVLANAPRTITDKLQRVLNAAAQVITGTLKFDRGLTLILRNELHWLDIPQRVIYSSSNCAQWCTSVCTVWCRGTLQNSVYLSRTYQVIIISTLLPVVF